MSNHNVTLKRNIWVYKYPVDIRKQIDGLCTLISERMNMNPQSGDIFVFFNYRADKAKCLFYDGTGFVLVYKRLERGTFQVPHYIGQHIHLTRSQLAYLLKGLPSQTAVPGEEHFHDYF